MLIYEGFKVDFFSMGLTLALLNAIGTRPDVMELLIIVDSGQVEGLQMR